MPAAPSRPPISAPAPKVSPPGSEVRGETAERAAHDGAEHAGAGRLRCFAHCEFATHPLQDLRTRGAREPVKPNELVG